MSTLSGDDDKDFNGSYLLAEFPNPVTLIIIWLQKSVSNYYSASENLKVPP